MEKLELKHLAPYLPYGLKGINAYGNLVSILPNNYLNEYGDFIGLHERCKLALRPLSDLTKEITHNGETFVPMLELAYLMPDYIMVDYNGTLDNYNLQIDDDWNFCITFNGGLSDDMCLSYDKFQMSFYLTIGFSEAMVAPQYEMFQKLLEWHFDVFGLIKKGLAIDINTLTK